MYGVIDLRLTLLENISSTRDSVNTAWPGGTMQQKIWRSTNISRGRSWCRSLIAPLSSAPTTNVGKSTEKASIALETLQACHDEQERKIKLRQTNFAPKHVQLFTETLGLTWAHSSGRALARVSCVAQLVFFTNVNCPIVVYLASHVVQNSEGSKRRVLTIDRYSPRIEYRGCYSCEQATRISVWESL